MGNEESRIIIVGCPSKPNRGNYCRFSDVEVFLRMLSHPPAIHYGRRNKCRYQTLCERFVNSRNIRIADQLFDRKFDFCYCKHCHDNRHDELYHPRGSPAKPYGLPVGFCRFGLQVEKRAHSLNAFSKWHVAFHGTNIGSVPSILECGGLLLPGDRTLKGTQLREAEGHFNDAKKPDGFDTKKVFVTPSIHYAAKQCYAATTRFFDFVTGEFYEASVVLQVRILPGSYDIGPQTIGADYTIDPMFKNEEIEWSTKNRGAIIIYGLLVKLEEL